MDIASIASFLLPTLLSMLSGEGKNQENFFSSSKKSSKNMYGYGYRYPRVPRVPLYEDPKYQFKWVRAAVGNRAISKKSKWIDFLRKQGAFKVIGSYLRALGDAYREIEGGVKDSTLKSAQQRAKKIEKAIAALKNQDLLDKVKEDLGKDYDPGNAQEAIAALERELERINELLKWKPTGQYSIPTIQVVPGEMQKVLAKKGSGLTSGMGLTSGLGYGYGYFY
jgi:hypothetical protein